MIGPERRRPILRRSHLLALRNPPRPRPDHKLATKLHIHLIRLNSLLLAPRSPILGLQPQRRPQRARPQRLPRRRRLGCVSVLPGNVLRDVGSTEYCAGYAEDVFADGREGTLYELDADELVAGAGGC